MGRPIIYTDRDGKDRMETGFAFNGSAKPWDEEMFRLPVEVDEGQWRIDRRATDSECVYVHCVPINGVVGNRAGYQMRLLKRMGLR